ncbi:hypothetical protein BGZ80_001081 [Entomortierella chlamydospora]|uniref:Eisosome component PIL1-domain-containing protein n=1 Tax=Entomortierella chlamydospora TaxID=101097 RepID=A0A9P6SXZ8_9FUNG|nr:hypothetical protein BGZ79_000519 [Entomortierella chlamydospora]KAG0010925.1 hypothetical protein BGZ80_001081 [Entomortierella chlamydospora]
MQSIKSQIQESARHAAGQFLTPLSNAIAEQRRLVESLALVSKVRVEECKHMMTWSKYQTEDLADVLLKLNLLIRKISDYELRFGTQYEQFREKIKVLRTKDDTLCEMGRVQTDLVEASKSRLRTAKNYLLQKESEASQSAQEQASSQLQQLKRNLIKEAYEHQMDSVIELGRKMQIIGEHGKKLLEHIDVSCSDGTYDQGHDTEDILQAARIALENWDQIVVVSDQTVVVHSSPAITPEGRTKSTKSSASKGARGSASLKSKASAASTLAPPLPPRQSDEAPATPKPERDGSYEATQEELDIKMAIELSLAEAAMKEKESEDLHLSADSAQSKKQTNKGGVENDQDAVKTTGPSRTVRGPQAVESDGHVTPQRGPTPGATTAHVEEELGDSTSIAETMGEYPEVSANKKSNQDALESMGGDQDYPLESMGPDGCGYEASYTPSAFTQGESPRQSIQTSRLKQIERQLSSPFPPSPELQYLQVQNSPQIIHQSYGGVSTYTPAPQGSYKPATSYVPHTARQKNHMSDAATPPPNDGLQTQLANQKAYQLAHQQSYQQYNQSPSKQLQPQQQRSLRQQQYFQEQKQKLLQDFYYTPNEQEQWSNGQDQQYANASAQQQGTGSWNYPVHNSDTDYRYKEEVLYRGQSHSSDSNVSNSSNYDHGYAVNLQR